MNKAITILVVDDNIYMREMLCFLISHSEGMSVLGEASSGLEAISMAADLNPDIILIDINMSPINGFEATRKIIKNNPAARIIGISVHNQSSYARNIMHLGAKGYLTKSSSHKEIMHAIEEVAAGKEYVCNELKGLL